MNNSQSTSFHVRVNNTSLFEKAKSQEESDSSFFHVLHPLIQSALKAEDETAFKQSMQLILSSQRKLTTALVDLLGKQAIFLEQKRGRSASMGILWLKYGVPLVDLNLTCEELLDLLREIGFPEHTYHYLKRIIEPRPPHPTSTPVTREALFDLFEKLLDSFGKNEAPLMERFETVGFSEEERIALARKCAKSSSQSMNAARYFRKFEIRDETVRLELARAFAHKSTYLTWAPIEELEQFEITDTKALEELALFYTKTAPACVPPHIRKFHLQTPEARIQIARLCMQKASSELAAHFADFEIPDEKTRYPFAKECAEINPEMTAQHFKQFDLTNAEEQLEIARICVQKADASAAQYLAQFTLLSEETRMSLMRQGMMTDYFPSGFLERAAECRFSDTAFIKELILTYFKNARITTELKSLPRFGIKDSEVLYELAKALITDCSIDLSKYIRLFALTPARKLELALLYAERDGSDLLKNFADFEIEDPHALNRVLEKVTFNKSCYADLDWNSLLEHGRKAQPAVSLQLVLRAIHNTNNGAQKAPGIVHRLGIKNFRQLLQIAQACVSDYSGAQAVANHFDHFGAKSEKEILELISILNTPRHQIPLLVQHQFPDSEQWISLMCHCISKDPETFELYLPRLQRLDRAVRVKLAKVCAKTKSSVVAKNYHLFDLGDDEALHLEIAMDCVRSMGGHCFASYVRNFGLKDVRNRWTLARFCIRHTQQGIQASNGKQLQELFNAFELNPSSEEMFSLALECAHHDPLRTLTYLHHFGIEDPEQLLQLIMQCERLIPSIELRVSLPSISSTSEPRMLEHFKQCMTKSPITTFSALSQSPFPISEEDRYELALIAIQAGYPLTVANQLAFLNIASEEKRATLAKLCFAKGSRFSDNQTRYGQKPSSPVLKLSNFHLSEDRLLHALFPVALQRHPKHTIQMLPSFKLNQEEDLLSTLLGLLSDNTAEAIASNLQAFSLNHEARKKLALACVKNHANPLTSQIKMFDLDEETRVAIAQELIDHSQSNYLVSTIQDFNISDIQTRTLFAKKCAENAAPAYIQDFKYFNLNGQGRFDVAMILAAKGGSIASHLAQSFYEFDIQDMVQTEAIALQAAKAGPDEYFVEYVERFHLQNPNLLHEIFELLLSQHGAGILKWSDTFYPPNHLIPLERAPALARMSSNSAIGVAKFVRRFSGRQDHRETLYEIAAICVEQSDAAAAGVIRHLKSFGFDGSGKWEQLLFKAVSTGSHAVEAILSELSRLTLSQETRIALFQKCKEFKPEETIENRRKFQIDDSDINGKGALAVSYTNDYSLRSLIASVNRAPSEDRLQLVLTILSKAKDSKALEWILRFDLDEKQRLSLALMMPIHCYSVFIQNLPHFNIQHSEDRMQIAIKFANQHPNLVAKYFSSFALTTPDQRVRVAEACITTPTEHELYSFPYADFDHFGIESEEERVRLARLAAECQPYAFMNHLHRFTISNKSDLLTIAEKAINQNPQCPLEAFVDLFIGEERQLLPILERSRNKSSVLWRMPLDPSEMRDNLLKCAQVEPNCLAKNLNHYEIEDQELLYALAKKIVKYGEPPIDLNIFNLVEEEKRFKIAMQMIRMGKLPLEQFKEGLPKLRITSPKKLSELAQALLGTLGIEALKIAKDMLTINEESDLFKMLVIAARVSPIELAEKFESTSLQDESKRLRLFLECVRYDEEAFMHIERFALNALLESPLFKAINLLKIHQETVHPAVYVEAKNYAHCVFPEESHQELFKLIGTVEALPMNFQHTSIKWLFHSLLVMGLKKNQASAKWAAKEQGPWLNLLALRAPSLRAKLNASLATLSRQGENGSYWEICAKSRLPLLSLVLVQLEKKGVNHPYLHLIAQTLTHRAKDKDSKFRDALTVQRLLMLLATIANHQSPSEEKDVLVRTLFRLDHSAGLTHKQEEEILERVDAMQGLFGLRRIKDLVLNPTQEPSRLFEKAFQTIVPIAHVSHFSSKFQSTFGSCRKPEALRTYASRINSLRDENAMNTLVHYVTGVMNGTFPDDRYSLDNNPHLKIIFEWRKDIQALWREEYKRPLSDFSHQKSEKKAFDTVLWLKQKLFSDRHLKSPLPHLENYLNTSNPSLIDKLSEALKHVPIAERRDIAYKELKVQQLCMLLARASQEELMKGTLIKQLVALIEKTPALGQEFLNDLTGLKLILSGGQKQAGALNVVLSDHYVDLLLCGTEVAGSCQRVDGDVSQNRGLLAYLVDGKNKILVIKDQRGRIHARALLRLLWQNDRPALFFERIYPAGAPQEQTEALIQAAKEIAGKMRLSLYQTDPPSANRPPKLLEALGGPSPYEYVDAARKIAFKGQFSHLGYLLQE